MEGWQKDNSRKTGRGDERKKKSGEWGQLGIQENVKELETVNKQGQVGKEKLGPDRKGKNEDRKQRRKG